MSTGKGVDFSPRWQKDTPIPSGVEYAWVKVADGGSAYRLVWPDEMVKRFKARGIPLGGYSYAQPGNGAAHARALIAECRRLGILDLVPVTDIESDPNIHTWSTAEAIAYGRAFCQEIIRQGFRPGVYMNSSMARQTRPDQWGIPGLVIWIARYGAKPEELTKTGPGAQYLGRYDVHQYTSSPVDWNQAYTNNHFAASGGEVSNGEEDDMTPEQDQRLREIAVGFFGKAANVHPDDRPEEEALISVPDRLTEIEDKLDGLAAGSGGTAEPLDYAKLAKALLAELANPTA